MQTMLVDDDDDDGIALIDIKNHDNTIYAMTNAMVFWNRVWVFRNWFQIGKIGWKLGVSLILCSF